jgi:hypothetical protein
VPVRGVHGERGLADAGHPADRMDAHHAVRTRADQLVQLPLPPGERVHVAGERPGGSRNRRGQG